MLSRILHQFKLSVLSINIVENSHNYKVYKCILLNGENVFIKIPYTKLKYQRELEAYVILEGRVSIPRMLDYWSGNEECPGAFLLSELKGTPLAPEVSPKIAFQVGVLHASMHQIQPAAITELTGIKNEFPNWSKFIERQFYGFAEDAGKVLDERLYKLAIEKFEMMKRQLPLLDGQSFLHMYFHY